MSTTSTVTGTLSSPGIGSGLDVNSIVSKLVAVESLPLKVMQTQAASIQTDISTFGQISSDLSALEAASSALQDLTTWKALTLTSNTPSAITGSTSSGALAGSLSVQVNSLATSQTLASAAVPNSASGVPGTIGTAGTLTIQMGSWNSDGSFTNAVGVSGGTAPAAVSVTVSATDTLATIAAHINSQSSAAGVSAQVVTSGNNQSLLITGNATGAASGFMITPDTGTDASGAANPLGSLDSLGYYASTTTTQVPASTTNGVVTPAHYPPGGGLTQSTAASDASLVIQGIAVTSASNNVTTALSGVTLNLLTTTTSPVQLTMAVDTASITTKIQAFQTAYNQLNSDIATSTAYDSSTKTGGPLLGDTTTYGIQNMVRSILGANGPTNSTIGRLSDLGLQVQADGSLTTNSTMLAAALQNPSNVQKFFANVSADGSNDGIATRMYNFSFGALGVGGLATLHTAGYQTTLATNSKNQATFNTHIAAYQAQLLAQYNALDTTMGSLSSLSSFVTAQLAQWSKSS